MEDLLPFLSESFEIEFIKRSRGFFSKTFGITWKILRAKGDLFHVNYALQDSYITAKFKRLDVLYCHGSDVRYTIKSKKYGWMVKSNLQTAKTVLYSTEDMKELLEIYRKDAIFMVRPVRTDLFKQKTTYGNPPKAIYFPKPYEAIPRKLVNLLNTNRITVMTHHERIPYKEMPFLLSKFDVFIDRFSINSLSKTCLEAMSCGLATIDYRHNTFLENRIKELADIEKIKKQGKENRKFVEENHNPKSVAKTLSKIWNELC